MVGPILEALERKIGLRRDATRAPLRAPEWQRATSMPRPPRNTQISTRPRLTYCGPKLVLTKGSTLAGGVGQPSTLLGRAVSPGSFFSAPSQAALAGLPASCRVKAVIRPTADSEIKIE